MKNGIAITAIALIVIMAGGLSLGCIDAPEPVIVEPVVIIVPEVLPVEFTEPEEFNSTIVVIELVIVEVPEVEVIMYKVTYNPCITVLYPENLEGYDTPCERCLYNQAKLDKMVEHVDGDKAYCDFYMRLYQGDQDKYERMYEYVGNTILTDSNDPIVTEVGAFNFTSPWGHRNLGNGSFTFDTCEGTVSFVGSEEIASGGAVELTEEGAIISNMYYTYMGCNATLPGSTEVSF